MADEILFDRTGDWGVITLNRPAALNALTWGMVQDFRKKIVAWDADPACRAILIRGAGDRAFSAGGDLRWLYDTATRDPVYACGFFKEEYRNNAAIHRLTTPFVALIDGIVMGGGVGVSVHGDFRVVGDRTVFAMPETAIGLFPDVGGAHFLPRLHDGIGLYYALTGARAKAADCMASGIATHYTPTDQMPALEKALLERRLTTHAHGDVEAVLDAFAGDPGHAPLNDFRSSIAETFQGHSQIEALVAALRRRGGDFAGETLATLSRMSPTSLKITFAQMQRGLGLDFDDVMRMEFRIVRRVMEGHDFFEGVRAQIIDKDKNPIWSPITLEGVGDDAVEDYFAPLGEEELQLP